MSVATIFQTPSSVYVASHSQFSVNFMHVLWIVLFNDKWFFTTAMASASEINGPVGVTVGAGVAGVAVQANAISTISASDMEDR